MATYPARQRWLNMGFAGVWLVFLLRAITWFTVMPPAQRVLAAVILVIFSANYLLTFWRYPQALEDALRTGRSERGCWIHYGISLLLSLAGLACGGMGFALTPYLQAHASYTLPGRFATFHLPVLLGVGGGLAYWFDTPVAAIGGVSIGIIIVYITSMFARREAADQMRERRRAVEQAHAMERERIARDLHDLLGHSLTVMALKAQVVERLAERDPARAATEARELHSQIRDALTQLRSTVGALRAMDLDEQLQAARAACAAAHIGLRIDDCASRDNARAAVFAWIVREAITNVIRHAHATQVDIEVSDTHLRVSDNGRGFAPSGSAPAGLGDEVGAAPNDAAHTGISSMQARAQHAGMCCHISSSPAGTVVEVRDDSSADC